jgi:hypothetical protein
VLLLVVLVNAKYFAIPILVLQNMSVLLSLEPGVTEIEEDRFDNCRPE